MIDGYNVSLICFCKNVIIDGAVPEARPLAVLVNMESVEVNS